MQVSLLSFGLRMGAGGSNPPPGVVLLLVLLLLVLLLRERIRLDPVRETAGFF